MKSQSEHGALPSGVRKTELAARNVSGSRMRRRSGSVLLALANADHPTAVLRQSAMLARSLDAKLNVVRVLPEVLDCMAFWPYRRARHAARRREGCEAAARRTRAWCDEVLSEQLAPDQIGIRIGEFVDQATRRADELDARLIVLAPSMGSLSVTATALARAAARAVLIMRAFKPLSPLLAASDLEDDDSWVLQKAVELAAQLGAPIVAVHHINPLASVGPSSPCLASHPPPVWAVRGRQSRPTRATRQLHRPISSVLLHELDPVDAILHQSRIYRATIIVGTRPRSWLDWLIDRSIADEVVNRSERSVVVISRTPVAPRKETGKRGE